MITIRPALPDDVEATAAIHNHYVLNTVNSFTTEPRPRTQYQSAYHNIISGGLPYLVAVDNSSRTVIGYANAHDFRGGANSAYRHTVEISLFCHPDHRGKGVGSLLLGSLISALRDPDRHSELYCHLGDATEGPNPVREVKEVVCVMAVDELAEGGGLRLTGFYERFGFVLTGHLKRVGYKHGRWLDTMYLQLSL